MKRIIMTQRLQQLGLAAVVAVLSCVGSSAALAQSRAGEVEFARGINAVKQGQQPARVAGKGTTIAQGDVITTGENSYAIIKLDDGTRMTVRPNSQLAVQTFDFREGREENSMVLRLLKGGLRTVTGLIPKRSGSAARIETATATIGIRGTDFDARICERDCAAENAKRATAPKAATVNASARVVMLQGTLTATSSTGERRVLGMGGPAFPGDTLETSANGYAVIAFRDQTKTTLQSGTRFRIEDFVFDANNPREGRYIVNLLKGGLRSITGLIGRANTKNVTYQTQTATIGIRGTGVDVNCVGTCAGEPSTGQDTTLGVWDGEAEMTNNTGATTPPGGAGQGGSNTVIVRINQAAAMGEGNQVPVLLVVLPDSIANNPFPRPDQVKVDFQQLFGQQNVSGNDSGLYITVRDGHIALTQDGQTVDLGRGEMGFAGVGGAPLRGSNLPNFIQFDQTPIPGNNNTGRGVGLLDLLNDANIRVLPVCKA